MSEIKGQLLGIILTLMVFAAVSVTVASLYNSTAEKVTTYGTNVEVPAGEEVHYDNGSSALRPGSFAFPGLSY